jgi:hypothetical protein
VGYCECGNELLGSIKCGEILDYVRNCQLLKKVYASWSWLKTCRYLSNIYGLYPGIRNFMLRLIIPYTHKLGARGGTVVEALHYKPEGREFDSRWCHWIFFIDIILPVALMTRVDSTSNRNEYQEYFLGVKAAGA